MRSRRNIGLFCLLCMLFFGCDKEKTGLSEPESIPENQEKPVYSAEFVDIPDEISFIYDIKATDEKFYLSGYIDNSTVTEEFVLWNTSTDNLVPYDPKIDEQYINDFVFKDDKVYVCYADDEYNNYVAITDRKGKVISEYKIGFSNISDMFFDNDGMLCILEVVQPFESDNVINNVHIYDDDGNSQVISLDEKMNLEADDAVVKISGDKSGNIYVLTQKTEPLISSLYIQGKTILYKVDSSYNVSGKFSHNEVENEYISDFVLTDDEKLNVIISDESPHKKVYSVNKDTYEILSEYEIGNVSNIYHGTSEYDILYETFSGDGIYGHIFETQESIVLIEYTDEEDREFDISQYYSYKDDILISTEITSNNEVGVFTYDTSGTFDSLEIQNVNENGSIESFYVAENGHIYCFENSEISLIEENHTVFKKSYVVSHYDSSGKFISLTDITDAIGQENDITVKDFSVDSKENIYIICTDMSYSMTKNILLMIDNKLKIVVKEAVPDDYIDFDIILADNLYMKATFTDKEKLYIKEFDSTGEIMEKSMSFDYPETPEETTEVYSGITEDIVYCRVDNKIYRYIIAEEKFDFVLDFDELNVSDAHYVIPVNSDDMACMVYDEDFKEKFVILKKN